MTFAPCALVADMVLKYCLLCQVCSRRAVSMTFVGGGYKPRPGCTASCQGGFLKGFCKAWRRTESISPLYVLSNVGGSADREPEAQEATLVVQNTPHPDVLP